MGWGEGVPKHLAAQRTERRQAGGCRDGLPRPPELTAVLLVAAIGTVLKSIATEAANDAVDAAGAGEESRATFRFCFGYRRKRNTEGHQGMEFAGHSLLSPLPLNVL